MGLLVSRSSLAAALLVLSCVTARPVAPPATPAPGPAEEVAVLEVARAFTVASRARRFDVVHGLLSSRWRAESSAATLEVDFDAEPLAAARVGRVEEALASTPRVQGTTAELLLGRAVTLVLVREAGAWRVDGLGR